MNTHIKSRMQIHARVCTNRQRQAAGANAHARECMHFANLPYVKDNNSIFYYSAIVSDSSELSRLSNWRQKKQIIARHSASDG